jgi:alpha-ketoglutarate-dependent taurine dioxygenase
MIGGVISPAELPPSVAGRLLSDAERPFPTEERGVPFVIEARERRDVDFLNALLKERSATFHRLLAAHGAVLLRGFHVATQRDFEAVLTSIDGLVAMDGYFMTEFGRDTLPGSNHVMFTSRYVKTGGGLQIGNVHSENYYVPDVPSVQSFWCEREGWLGGETAFVHMGNAYAELPQPLREKLERGAAPAPCFYWLSAVADQYGVSEEEAAAFFQRLGIPLTSVKGRLAMLVHKPNVYHHPHTGRRSLQVNLSEEIGGFHPAFERVLAPFYAGWRWALHRLAWRHSLFFRLWAMKVVYGRVLGSCGLSLGRWRALLRDMRTTRLRHRPGWALPERPRIAERLEQDDVAALVSAVRKHLAAIRWRRGDVIVFDNLQMLHAGLPGFGPRELRVMLFNPIPYAHPIKEALMVVPPGARGDTLHGLLRRHATALREAS